MTAAARKPRQRPRLARGEASSPSSSSPSGIAALAATMAEMQADLRGVHARLDRLDGPQRPPADYVPLKVAAGLSGFSVETMRTRAVNREVDALRIGGKWFVKSPGIWESSRPARGGKVAA
jgi:hypothetical protein